MSSGKVRHILALSGGKDSAALAVYMRMKHPELPIEYVFTDSGCELPETYEYLERIKAVLQIEVVHLRPKKDFRHYLTVKGGYLPSAKNRWCTEYLKLRPYRDWLARNCAGALVHSYVGLRCDEERQRTGFRARPDTLQHHPFIEDAVDLPGVIGLLEDSGIGLPSYYSWRSRSGCYFCFFQTKREWLGLWEHHREKFLEAQDMETVAADGTQFTWCDDMSLRDLLANREQILDAPPPTRGGKRAPRLAEVLALYGADRTGRAASGILGRKR